MTTAVLRGPAPAPARFRHLLIAEWIKLWSLRSTYWVLSTGALTVIGINANSAQSNADRLSRMPEQPPAPPPGATEDPLMAFDALHTAFLDPAWQIFMVVACSVGAIAVFGEYTSGLIRTTLTAVPDRRAVVLAKAAVVTGVMTVLGAVVATATLLVTQFLLRDHGGVSLAYSDALRAVAGSALLAPLCALVGMAIGAVVRHAAGAIVGAILTLLLLPVLFQGETYRWVAEIGNAMPLSAWETLAGNHWGEGKYSVTVTEAWAVYAAWAACAVLVAVEAVRRSEV
ncbi:ABC transporter permease subunit [Streptomyces sp. YC504]|uniref:ABC transporter permease subunit n=1 Tax=Streptomyces mesophilus TaxID=1775132 RepID=A0A6G4XKJ8_9ACTN|nr:ABC transporter permease subunit [Streptomyces mesophilus]NGO78089.1 ABC transporter permease subunit [Streptomyces mesophilus]